MQAMRAANMRLVGMPGSHVRVVCHSRGVSRGGIVQQGKIDVPISANVLSMDIEYKLPI
jgi:hypothetical protein